MRRGRGFGRKAPNRVVVRGAAAAPAPTAEIWLPWGDSIGVGSAARDGGDLDWPGVYQVRTRAPAGISADISPLDQAIAPDGTSWLSPLEYFGKQRTDDIDIDIYLVPHCSNGSSLGAGGWGVGNTLHEAFITRANAAIQTVKAANPAAVVGGIIQFEGSNDANVGSTPLTYRAALIAAIDDMRSRIFKNGISGATIADTPYIINGLIPEYLSTANRVLYEQALRYVAQQTAGGKFYKMPEGIHIGDNLHPSAAGTRSVGTGNALLLKDTTGPVVTGVVAPGTYSVYESQKMLLELTSNEYAYWTLSGAGASNYEIVWISDGDSGIDLSRMRQYLRWNGDGTKTPGNYPVTLVAEDASGNVTNHAFSTNVLAAYGNDAGDVTLAFVGAARIAVPNVTVKYKIPAVTFGAGLNNLTLMPGGATSSITAVKVGGVVCSKVANVSSGDLHDIWSVPLAQAGAYDIEITFVGTLQSLDYVITVWNSTKATPSSFVGVPAGYRNSPQETPSITVPTNGMACGSWRAEGVSGRAPLAGVTELSDNDSTAPYQWVGKRSTTGTLGFSHSGGGFMGMVAIAYERAT